MRGFAVGVFCVVAFFASWTAVVIFLQMVRVDRWGVRGAEVWGFFGVVVAIIASILDVAALLLVFG